jgi:hypothetical protein
MPENVQCVSFFSDFIIATLTTVCQGGRRISLLSNFNSRWGVKRNTPYLQHGFEYVSDNLMGSLQTEREDEFQTFSFENFLLIT